MKHTTLKIDAATRGRLKSPAQARGLSVHAYLASLVDAAEHAELLDTAATTFRCTISEPGVAQAFDRDFGDR
ncbi:antitoxin MazE7 [Streptomyces sp. NBC_01190]|uniref:antitoxin MazE7 n=1 Tax=Streptomyces sp. NBC_01190 TaxID=2903767 RepID=UPI0038643742|nr:antitoxin MazE7 [Streptomyces sp. NBC_01190]WSS24149.1 antitoxin MazE7 [Streptomyces sp. NBC_01190]